MRKNLFLVAAVAVALSSCSKNEVGDSNLDNKKVGFGVYTGESVKSGASDVMTTDGLKGTGFGVFTYYDLATQTNGDGVLAAFTDESTPDFMYNTKVAVEENETEWTYSPMKYWPNNTNDVLSFFAYGPQSSNATGDAITFDKVGDMKGAPVLTYTMLDADKMVDFVVAAPKYDVNNTTDYNVENATIDFTFKHLLTRASFDAYVDVTDFPDVNSDGATTPDDNNTLETANTKVYVTKMAIIGAKGTTELVDKTNTIFTEKSAGFYTSADFIYMAKGATAADEDVEGVGSWDFTNATTNDDDFDFSAILDKTDVAFGAYKTVDGVDVGTTATPLFANSGDSDEQFLFLLPSSSEGVAAGSEMYVYIEYDVVTLDSNLELGYSVVTNKDVVTLAEGTLKPGFAYKYTLVIGLDEVRVSAEVDGWVDGDDTNIVTPEDKPSDVD